MKKTYFCPSTDVVKVGTMTMIAATTIDRTKTNPDVDITNQTGGYDGTFSSRHHNNIWDDEEEEEEQ